MDDFLGKKIKDALTKGTEQSVPLKENIWTNLEKAINTGKHKPAPAAKRKPRYWGFAVAAVAAMVMTFGAFTPEGQAAAKKIKDILLPEKSIVQDIEGDKEKTKVSLEESSIGYTIYVDRERYEMVKEDGKDKIVPNPPLPKNYPQVFMEIYQIKDKDPGTVLKQLDSELKEKYQEVKYTGEVQDPVKGMMISAYGGNKSNDIIDRYYLVDNTQKGTFVIREHYFREAAEGHGARFYHMLKEFRLVRP